MRNWTWLGLLAGCTGLLLEGRAAAQECATNDDCMRGFVCEVTGASGCGFACPDDGQPCVPPPDFSCETMEFRSCVPGPCASDADCEAGMVCFAQESFDCPMVDIACAPGEVCPQASALIACNPTVKSSCVPQYVPPCQVDADCGAGFKCVEDVSFSCGGSEPSSGGSSGGAGDPVPGTAGSAAPVPVQPPECMEAPTGTFHCEVVEVVCATDADCEAGWTCLDSGVPSVTCSGRAPLPTEPAPMRPALACPSAIPAVCRLCADNSCGQPVCQADGTWKHVCPEDADADSAGFAPPPGDAEPVPPPECMVDPTFVPTRLCTPPFFDIGIGFPTATPVAMGGVATGSTGEADGTPPPRADDGSATSDGDAPDLMAEGESASEEPAPLTSKACAVHAPGTGESSVLALGLLGLCALGLRRRARS